MVVKIQAQTNANIESVKVITEIIGGKMYTEGDKVYIVEGEKIYLISY